MMITLATAGVLGLIYLVLSVRVTMARRATQTMMGDGGGKPGSEALVTAMRAHANFAEYVPLILILMAGIELAGGSHTLLVILAVLLVIGRALHPVGMAMPGTNPFRAGGAAVTWLVLLVAGVWALSKAL